MNILYEDNHIIVVEKPVNIPVQEDSSHDRDLLNMVKDYVKVKYNKPGNVYIGLVHRLDRPVGGVMVFARTSKSASRLSDQIRLNKNEKTYFAVTKPQFDEKKSNERLEHYLLKNEKINKVKVGDNPFSSAKKAVLYYEVVEKREELCLVKVKLETGRPHQIRAQLSHVGLPIWGDQKYGDGIPGQQLALWSHQLKLEHPITKEWMSFISNPPINKHPWSNFNSRSFYEENERMD